AKGAAVRIENWTPEAHVAWLGRASAGLDIKGSDFRQQHKPAVKAIDFIASGLPLAMNRDSSSVEYLAGLGFDVTPPEETERWFAAEYREETRRFGAALRELLSRERVAARLCRVIDSVLDRSGSPTVRARRRRGSGSEALSVPLAARASGAALDQ